MATDLTVALSKLPTPSLPPRVAALAMSVGTVQHPGQPVRYNLPEAFSMTEADRTEAETLRSTLAPFLDRETLFDGHKPRDAKLAILTTMLMGYAIGAGSELGNDAKFDLYELALDDVPAWAVAAALRLWARGECPADVEKNPTFKYAPSPATLRGIAMYEIEPYRWSVYRLTNLLNALPREAAMDPKPLPKSFGVGPALRRM